jgi:hypothetical protein
MTGVRHYAALQGETAFFLTSLARFLARFDACTIQQICFGMKRARRFIAPLSSHWSSWATVGTEHMAFLTITFSKVLFPSLHSLLPERSSINWLGFQKADPGCLIRKAELAKNNPHQVSVDYDRVLHTC